MIREYLWAIDLYLTFVVWCFIQILAVPLSTGTCVICVIGLDGFYNIMLSVQVSSTKLYKKNIRLNFTNDLQQATLQNYFLLLKLCIEDIV